MTVDAQASTQRGNFAWDALLGAMLAGVWALILYRGFTWPITHDEALTYNTFLAGGWHNILRYGANNHVLFSWLAKFCVMAFGVSERSLRLPTLLAAGVYLWCIRSICREWFAGGWRVLAAGLLAINPLVLDYLVAARGYGLALTFLMLALWLMLRDWRDADLPGHRGRRVAIGIFAALSVTANMAFAPVVVGLIAVGLWRRIQLVRWFEILLPAVVVGVPILAPYLGQVRSNQLKVGFSSIGLTAVDIMDASLWHDQLSPKDWPQVHQQEFSPASAGSIWGVAGLCIGALVLALCVVQINWRPNRGGAVGHAVATIVVAALAVVVFLHVARRVPYPLSRTGIYLVPLTTLAVLLPGANARRLRWPVAIFGVALLAMYATQLDSQCFEYAGYDTGSRQIFLALQTEATGKFNRPVRVGGTWIHQPAMDFYREKYHANWMNPMDRAQDKPMPIPTDYDYFVSDPNENALPKSVRWRVMMADPFSGTRLLAQEPR